MELLHYIIFVQLETEYYLSIDQSIDIDWSIDQ